MVVDNVQQLNKLLTDFFDQLWTGINENVLPALNESLKKLGATCASIYDELASIALNLIKRGVNQLKAFESDFGKVGKELKESLKSLFEALSTYANSLRTELNEIFKLVTDTIKDIPAYEALKEKFSEVSSMNDRIVS